MSWALDEFFAAVGEEFGVAMDGSDEQYLETPGEVSSLRWSSSRAT